MKRKMIIALVCLCLMFSATVARAQFGLTVFDPSVYFEAVAQVNQLVKQYQQLVQDLRPDHEPIQPDAVHGPARARGHARTLPGDPDAVAQFDRDQYVWHYRWLDRRHQLRRQRRGRLPRSRGSTSGLRRRLNNVPADQVDRLKKNYASVELTDGSNIHSIETIGTLRRNASQVETTIAGLEQDSLSADPNMNTEVAVLNKINASSIIALRNSQDTNKVLVALAEQQVVQSKQQRDAESRAINNHIQFMGQEQAILTDQKAGTTAAMLGFRMP